MGKRRHEKFDAFDTQGKYSARKAPRWNRQMTGRELYDYLESFSQETVMEDVLNGLLPQPPVWQPLADT
ncbi:MAG: hypothetical protein IPK79_11975 [Vampirovibrionales bacterium]|nr:hypothetical protein [Vampirovibrionales bacterium]